MLLDRYLMRMNIRAQQLEAINGDRTPTDDRHRRPDGRQSCYLVPGVCWWCDRIHTKFGNFCSKACRVAFDGWFIPIDLAAEIVAMIDAENTVDPASLSA